MLKEKEVTEKTNAVKEKLKEKVKEMKPVREKEEVKEEMEKRLWNKQRGGKTLLGCFLNPHPLSCYKVLNLSTFKSKTS